MYERESIWLDLLAKRDSAAKNVIDKRKMSYTGEHNMDQQTKSEKVHSVFEKYINDMIE